MSGRVRWEYMVSTEEHRLSEWGDEGWELVAVVPQQGLDGSGKFYFKRPFPSIRERVTLEQRGETLRQRNAEGGASS